MNLIINNENERKHVDDTYFITVDMLKFKSTHMFIASNSWDSMEILIGDNIDPEDVKYLHSVCDHIYCKLPSTINDKMVSVLCSVYPTLAGQIRMNYLMSSDLTAILPRK